MLEYTTLDKNASGVPDYVIELFKEWNINPKINRDFLYNQSLHWITNLGMYSKEVTETIVNLGYDGVYYGSEIIAFNPTQIKSVNNKGSWNPDNPNIYE